MTTDGNESPRVDVLTRDESGRFTKGASGNPAGRPLGVKNYGSSLRLTDIFRDLSPMLLEDLMERFRSGDEKARDFLLPRLWPESPKFSAYMHEKAREEEDWKGNTRKRLDEEIRLEIEREDDETKYFYLEYYLSGVVADLFTERGNFKIPSEWKDRVKPEDIDRAYIPSISYMSCAEVTAFAANLCHAVIMKPMVARRALEEARFSEELIYIIFSSIRRDHGDFLSGMLFLNFVRPCIRDNIFKKELVEPRLAEMEVIAKGLNRSEMIARERSLDALCKYSEGGEDGDDSDNDGSDDEESGAELNG
jgi:hypothetical protein